MEHVYPGIGQLVADAVPAAFSTAWVSVEMIDDVWGAEIFFQKEDGRYGYLNEGLQEIESKFRELREAFKDGGIEPWTTATFLLTSEGKMDLDLGYEDVSDFSLGPERRESWIKKYLGEEALIDWG